PPAAAYGSDADAPSGSLVGGDRARAPPPACRHHGDLRQGRRRIPAHAGPALAGRCGVTPLAAAAADYLAVRRALGFKLHHETWWLPDFCAYLESQGSSVITTALALSWAQQPPDGHRNW